MKYSADTSAFIQAWRRYYPPDVFPSVWDLIDKLMTADDLVASEEVIIELEKKDDEVLAWVRARSQRGVPIDENIQREVRQILAEHPRLLDTRRNRSGADPFVIALAKLTGAAVVTDEHPTNSPQRPNIPDVCNALGIPSLGVIDLLRAEGGRF